MSESLSDTQLRRLTKDAERYRFLNRMSDSFVGVGIWTESDSGKAKEWLIKGEIDKAVDAAMKKYLSKKRQGRRE